MTMKKKILTTLSVVLILGLAALGILAYLQSEDSDVNVMTLGNVQIEQHEYERVVENGAYKTDDAYGYLLKDFTQAKPLYPATEVDANGNPYNFGAGDYDRTRVIMSQVDSYGNMQVFTSKNAQDKFVTVENTGKSDAYVRTIVALELGNLAVADFDNIIGISTRSTEDDTNLNQPWLKNEVGVVEIDSNNYIVVEFVYHGAVLSDGSLRHAEGILPAGDTSYPNLCQVYMNAAATNEDCEAIDGNKNGTYDILVLSQAVQVEGFADAATALDTAFPKGENNANVAGWFTPIKWPGQVSTSGELVAAFKNGGKVKLANDIVLEEVLNMPSDSNVVLDMNGHKLTIKDSTVDPMIDMQAGSSLTITGNGTFDFEDKYYASLILPRGDVIIENGRFIKKHNPSIPANQYGVLFVGITNSTAKVVIKDGYFDGGYYDPNGDLSKFVETDAAGQGLSGDKNEYRIALKNNISKMLNLSANQIKVYGGTFVGANPAWGDEGCMLPTTPNYLRPWSYYQGPFLDGQVYNEKGVELPSGYTIIEGTHADGRPTYTVTYSK